MKVFVTGTGTNVGKTIVSSWICVHTGSDYFKPIQTGAIEATDSQRVEMFEGIRIHREAYVYPEPLSPHLAAKLNRDTIDLKSICLPLSNRLVVEGAGGVLVPINDSCFMIDLIEQFDLPVIVVGHSGLGTINHTLLTLEVLKLRKARILGVILSGTLNPENVKAIEYYGKIKVVAQIPMVEEINKNTLMNIPFPEILKNLFL